MDHSWTRVEWSGLFDAYNQLINQPINQSTKHFPPPPPPLPFFQRYRIASYQIRSIEKKEEKGPNRRDLQLGCGIEESLYLILFCFVCLLLLLRGGSGGLEFYRRGRIGRE